MLKTQRRGVSVTVVSFASPWMSRRGSYISMCHSLSVELPTLDVDSVFPDCHAQVFHGKYSPALIATLTTTTIPRPRRAQIGILCFRAAVFRPSTWRAWLRPSSAGKTTHRIVTRSVGGPDARVLICVRSYVCNELLGCKREEAGEMWGGLWRRW